MVSISLKLNLVDNDQHLKRSNRNLNVICKKKKYVCDLPKKLLC